MICDDLRKRWQGVGEAVLADVTGLEANDTVALRKYFRDRSLQMLVVKNSLARLATKDTPLGPAFDGEGGSTAVVWGAEDVVALAKEITKLVDSKKFAKFAPKGGVMEGAKLGADDIKAVSKWPSRGEQLSILMGQILSPGATLSSQLLGPARAIASQVKQISENDGESA
jgi:large subunit ribosomal protein L10